MCGRFAATASIDEITTEFSLVGVPERELSQSWNVAPTTDIYVIVEQRLEIMKWGLIPTWAKSGFTGANTINARSESVHEKPSFKSAFRARRCLIPATGYFEWATELGQFPSKQPFFIQRKDKKQLAMAGIYENGTAAIITKEAEGFLADIHHRMPLFLPKADWQRWLDPKINDEVSARDFIPHGLAPESAGLNAYPVSNQVNFVRNNSASLLTEIPLGEAQTLL
jgi:putative SOS response-associated peptidase YedK